MHEKKQLSRYATLSVPTQHYTIYNTMLANHNMHHGSYCNAAIPGIGGLRYNLCKFLTYVSSIIIRSRKNSAISSLMAFADFIRDRRTSTTCCGGRGSNASAYSVFVNPREGRGEASLGSGPSDITTPLGVGGTDRRRGGPL